MRSVIGITCSLTVTNIEGTIHFLERNQIARDYARVIEYVGSFCRTLKIQTALTITSRCLMDSYCPGGETLIRCCLDGSRTKRLATSTECVMKWSFN